MKCAYHPEADAVGACANCGRLICAECQIILEGESYCKPCTDKPFRVASVSRKGRLSPQSLVLRRGKTLGGVLLGFPLMLLYLIPAGLFAALLDFASEWFYGKDWWVLGAIFRIGEWVVGIGMALYFVTFFVMWLVMLVRVILGLEKELEE